MMNKSHAFLLPLVTAALLLTGCDTPGRQQAKYQAQQEEERKSIPPMTAGDSYFEGRIVASLSLMSGLPPAIQHSNRAPAKDGKKSSEPLFTPVAGSSNALGQPSSPYLTEEQSVGAWNGMTNNTPPPEPTREEMEAMLALKAESPLPPVMLRLFLKNTSDQEITVEFVDFDSQLGNFALQPGKMVIEPGKIAHPNNVISRLGLTSYAIPVTLTLRVDGKKETKVLKLHIAEAAPAN